MAAAVGGRDEVFAGVRSSQEEEHGWNATVQPLLRSNSSVLEVLSPTTLLLIFPSVPAYSITQPETIVVVVVVPASTVTILYAPGYVPAAA